MGKFKAGDTVVRNIDRGDSLTKGNAYMVKRYDSYHGVCIFNDNHVDQYYAPTGFDPLPEVLVDSAVPVDDTRIKDGAINAVIHDINNQMQVVFGVAEKNKSVRLLDNAIKRLTILLEGRI